MSGPYDNLIPPNWRSDEYDPVLFAENNDRELALWGDLLPAKRILQRRGFGVWWASHAQRRVNVGDRVVSVAEFKRMAVLHKRTSGIK